MEKLKRFITTYSNKLKYGLFFIFLLIMLIAVRTYINYTTIIDTTEIVNEKTTHIQEELDYTNNFLIHYLASDYAHLFLAHENNMLFWGETIIAFVPEGGSGKEELAQIDVYATAPSKQTIQENAIKNMNPPDAWEQFLKERMIIS